MIILNHWSRQILIPSLSKLHIKYGPSKLGAILGPSPSWPMLRFYVCWVILELAFSSSAKGRKKLKYSIVLILFSKYIN